MTVHIIQQGTYKGYNHKTLQHDEKKTSINITVVKELGRIVLSSSGTSQLGMFDIQATTKSKYYDNIVLLYLESRRCRYRTIIFVCFYLYVSVVNLIDYSDIDKMMDINNEKC